MARIQREAYIGPWLPEPALTDMDDSLHAGAPGRDARIRCRSAFLVLLEHLTPAERAVFLAARSLRLRLRRGRRRSSARTKPPAGTAEPRQEAYRRASPALQAHTRGASPDLTHFMQAVSNGELAGFCGCWPRMWCCPPMAAARRAARPRIRCTAGSGGAIPAGHPAGARAGLQRRAGPGRMASRP